MIVKFSLALQRLSCIHFIFILLTIDKFFDASYNFYHTDEQDGCFYYYVTTDSVDFYGKLNDPGHQIIEYCLNSNEQDLNSTDFDDTEKFWTFFQLKEKEVRSELLLRWLAPIDLAERYEIFLEDSNEWSNLSTNKFYNCTEGWFGSRCEYTFDVDDYTFDNIVLETFESKPSLWKDDRKTNGTCYIHLLCDRGASPSCLDWREICDRKKDCINGDVNEQDYCIHLETSECDQGEYRCRNGQCIPHAFFQDGDYDCSDATDEQTLFDDSSCHKDPSFQCEEHLCNSRNEFACGDGQCALLTVVTNQYGKSDSCANGRHQKMMDALLSRTSNTHLSQDCFFGMFLLTRAISMIFEVPNSLFCTNTSSCTQFLETIKCPSPYFFFPRYPVIDGHVRLVFNTNRTDFSGDTLLTPYLVCFNRTLCDLFVKTTVLHNGSTCHYYSDLDLSKQEFQKWIDLINAMQRLFLRCSLAANNDCTNLFQCPQSKLCISKHRLLNSVPDCFDRSDEMVNETCSFHDPYRFQCPSDRNRCISLFLIGNGFFDCPLGEDEQKPMILPLFSMICDWYPDIFPIFLYGREQTDETDCDVSFPCHNQYTECDGIWNCPNGIDEANCPSSICSPFHHPCVSLENNSIICLPLKLANDGIIHCRGGSDERHYCRDSFPTYGNRRYRCLNLTEGCVSVDTLCANRNFLPSLENHTWCSGEEKTICPSIYFQNDVPFYGICLPMWDEQRSEVEAQICNLKDEDDQITFSRRPKRYLTLRHAGYFPPSTTQIIQTNYTEISNENISSHVYRDTTISSRIWICNRGILVFKDSQREKRCFCPPAYYGDRCQYQNQRISLILQFVRRALLDRHLILHFVIMLIDEEKRVESYDSITYVSTRDCSTKFRLNLLYASRPRDPKKNYSVRIDAFNKKSLIYHSSWYLHIRFLDLPLNHLVARLFLTAHQPVEDPTHCKIDCGHHGQCVKYENVRRYFCRCLSGWYGDFCNTSPQRQCSTDSISVGVIGNRSICVCPLHKFGRFCHLKQTVCQANTCHSRGTCVSSDERISRKSFTCLCNEGYSGSRCELLDTKIIVSFADVSIPTSIYAHFITTVHNASHIRTSISKKIAPDQNTVTLYRSAPFHILFLEFVDNYYLIVVQEKYSGSLIISTSVLSSHRCVPISFLFNRTVLSYDALHRMKFYHKACEEQSALVCFHDERLMCLCNLHRYSNCFEFDHNMTYDCQGVNHCENGGQCFQNDPRCPVTSICVCPQCYFGSQCQFTTKTFDLSLDIILGYQIHPNVCFSNQPTSLKICLVLTIIIFIIGLINGSLTLITFKSKKLREVGCGNYLLTLSILCPFHLSIFALKFLFLVLSQMALVKNRWFLLASCKSMDFILKVLPNMRDWFHACVSVDRVVTISRGIHFDKTLSVRMSKVVIILVQFFVIGTTLHDPIYRQLIDDVEEQRTWCVVNYPPSLQVYNSTMDVLHFFVPFCINIFSALGIIFVAARTRSTARKNQTFKEHLWKQLREHKHLLISPLILTLLALPRLVISFLSGCMVSARNPWIFVISYFTSLISSASIFGVFVLPSNIYKNTFFQTIRSTHTRAFYSS